MQNNNNNNLNNNNNNENNIPLIPINLETFSLSDLNLIMSKYRGFKDKPEPNNNFDSPYLLHILDSNENHIALTEFHFPLDANSPEENVEFYWQVYMVVFY